MKWEVKGGNDDYQFEIIVKEFYQASNHNIRGQQIRLRKSERKANIDGLKSGTAYSATVYPISSGNTGKSTKSIFPTGNCCY